MILAATTPRPLAIAHRAGNDLEAFAVARAAGVDVVEADVWLYRGRLEVRHEKTAGPLPFLWDRWRLFTPWQPRLLLEGLLHAAQDGPPLMLDLKGNDARLPERVLGAVRERLPGRDVAVCSRNWNLLAALRHAPEVQPVYSAGSRAQLRALLRRIQGQAEPAISVHERLLTPAVLAALHDLRATVITWPVNTTARLRELTAAGIDGVISDHLTLLRAIVAQRSGASTAGLP